MNYPIYTEKTKCRDCYKCVRTCPVKAIKVENNSAEIIHELCIFCGRCVHICPAGAKKVRNDVPPVKEVLLSDRKVFLSLAPSWSSGLLGSREELIAKFKALGFSGVSETALGAQVVSQNVSHDLIEKKGVTVSSACPSIVELFKKYYPQNIDLLSPYHSPLGVHSAMLKKHYGKDCAVVFVGPCIAKKVEADNGESSIDFALTFDEVISWFEEEKDFLDTVAVSSNESFVPCSASDSTLYALEGGMIQSLNSCREHHSTPMIPLSGMSHIIDALSEIDLEGNMFLELLSCPGGCVNGSGFDSRKNQFTFRQKSFEYYNNSRTSASTESIEQIAPPEAEDIRSVYTIEPQYQAQFNDDQIDAALVELGKVNEEDLLNCGGCGYNSCRDFAVAYLRNMGEKQMCVTLMRKRAQRKMDMLLRTLPMGVVIVNRQMKIAECNSEFIKLFSEVDFLPDDDCIGKIVDLPINRFIDINSYLQIILSGEKNLFQERIKYGQAFLRVSFFAIEKNNLAGVIFQDITSTSLKREIVIKKAEEVINKNLQNVQQIASLLGENAAETEIILRSLTDEFQFTTPEVD